MIKGDWIIKLMSRESTATRAVKDTGKIKSLISWWFNEKARGDCTDFGYLYDGINRTNSYWWTSICVLVEEHTHLLIQFFFAFPVHQWQPRQEALCFLGCLPVRTWFIWYRRVGIVPATLKLCCNWPKSDKVQKGMKSWWMNESSTRLWFGRLGLTYFET